MEITAKYVADEEVIETGDGSYFKLANNRFDFGKISRKRSPDISFAIDFLNSGTIPLVILKADVSCGCLSVDYPQQPIYPNKSGKIRIKIDTRDQEGIFNKTIFFQTNGKNEVELVRIKGFVKK